MSIYWLVLTLPAAGLFAYWHPRWAARRDWKAIQEDGSKDSLKERFHFVRAVQRGVLQALVSLIAAAPLLPNLWPFILAAVGVGVASLAYFFFEFNPRLSQLRGLDPYYISSDPRAAFFPDRYIWRQVVESALSEESLQKHGKSVAAGMLRFYMRGILIAGLVVGAGLIGWAILLAL